MGRSRQRPIADSHNPTPRSTPRTSEPGTLPEWSALGVDTDASGFDPDWWSATSTGPAKSSPPSPSARQWVSRVAGFRRAGALQHATIVGRPNIVTTGVLVGVILIGAIGFLLITTLRAAGDTPPPTEAANHYQSAVVPRGTVGLPAGGGTGGGSDLPPTPEPTVEVTPTRVVAGPPAPRVAERVADEPVLYWLPEIIDASDETGVPASLIAAVIRVESQGNPDAVSPAGARGLMQLMPSHLEDQGVDPGLWHDPKTNIQAGALLLKWKIESTGNQWDGVRFYFGIKCDGFTCTEEYVNRVYVWRTHYAPIIAEG